jgi:acyl-ACP thioesterase
VTKATSALADERNPLLPRAAGARSFTQERRPGFADCSPTGRLRLDAIACWLQDVAYADVEDAGVQAEAVWVVRRTRIRINRFPRFGERFEATTFCSGLGRMWAERRTDIVRVDADADVEADADGDASVGDDAVAEVPDVEAVSVWVHLDPDGWRPTPLTDAEIAAYSGAADTRRVSARLRHPAAAPDIAADAGTWLFRLSECDIADHVNNAAYWSVLEEELLVGREPQRLDAEIEYRAPAQPGVKQVLRDGELRWILGGEELHATIWLCRDG